MFPVVRDEEAVAVGSGRVGRRLKLLVGHVGLDPRIELLFR